VGAAGTFPPYPAIEAFSLERSRKEGEQQMTKIIPNTDVHPLFHPAAYYDSPDNVLNDDTLSLPEKRVILSSWASDMYAVESCPSLREIPGMGSIIRLSDILAALRKLDGDDDPLLSGEAPTRLKRLWAGPFAEAAMLTKTVLGLVFLSQLSASWIVPLIAFPDEVARSLIHS
jgi:hypothetical protein